MEFEWALPLARYTEQWRQGRKLLDRSLGAGTSSAYRPLQQLKTRLLLTRLLVSPHEWEAHIELSALSLSGSSSIIDRSTFSFEGELTLDMTYGYDVQGRDDRKIEAARKVADMAATTALPSDLLVNGLPFCLYFLLSTVYGLFMTGPFSATYSRMAAMV